MPITQRVFMVGCPRSGTTILQATLAAHPRIASFPETNFFSKAVQQYRRRFGFRRGPRYRSRKDSRLRFALFRAKRHVIEDLRPSFIAHPAVNREVKRLLSHFDRFDLAGLYPRRTPLLGPKVRGMIGILDRLALDQDKSVWLEKTPVHVLYLDVIEKYLPEAKFVHIIRPGPDVVASIIDAKVKYTGWKKDKSRPIKLLRAIRLWRRCYESSMKYCEDGNHLLIHYMDFVQNPEAVIRKVCDFIGVEFVDGMLHPGDVDLHAIGATSPSKRDVAQGIRDPEDKFSRLFTPEQQAFIRKKLADPV